MGSQGLIILFVTSVLSVVTMVYFWKAISRKVAPGVEAMKQEAFTATVTRRENKIAASGTTGPATASVNAPYLVVYYRRDHDGQEASVMQYKGNSMDTMYRLSPGLRFYLEAPSYQELETWNEGDRLEKRAGEYFPRKIG